MSNLAIPAADQADTGLKHGGRPSDVRTAHSAARSTALRPDVAQREEGQLVVGGGRGAEGAYNISE
jgi:hypothetical protein